MQYLIKAYMRRWYVTYYAPVMSKMPIKVEWTWPFLEWKYLEGHQHNIHDISSKNRLYVWKVKVIFLHLIWFVQSQCAMLRGIVFTEQYFLVKFKFEWCKTIWWHVFSFYLFFLFKENNRIYKSYRSIWKNNYCVCFGSRINIVKILSLWRFPNKIPTIFTNTRWQHKLYCGHGIPNNLVHIPVSNMAWKVLMRPLF